MAADLYIHVLTVGEDKLRAFFSNTLGSSYHTWDNPDQDLYEEATDEIMISPQQWVGEVSWLKAALADDIETFVPGPIQVVADLLAGDTPDTMAVVDDDLIAKIGRAWDAMNTTTYRVADKDDVVNFLRNHMGSRVFTVSW